MARKRYKPEEIVAKLRQVDVLTTRNDGRIGFTFNTDGTWSLY
jgi:hypothetical protein